MAREALRPEDATSWDDFLDRIAQERSACSRSRGSVGSLRWVMAGVLLGVVLMALSAHVAGWDVRWWLWSAALVPLAIVIRIAFAAAERVERDDERLKELDLLELAWKSHLEHPRH
jgi:hypothetical protein